MSSQDLFDRLLRPKSIAIVGASTDTTSYAYRPLAYLQQSNFSGDLAAVNPRRTETLGVATYPTVGELPFVPDVVMVLVGADSVPAALEQCAEAGVRYAICVASGFGESGNSELDDAVRSICDGSQLRLLGPNCLGVINVTDGIPLSFSTAFAQSQLTRGHIGVVSQSGALSNVVVQSSSARGLGLSYVVTSGNELDLEWAEIALALIEQEQTHVLVGYVEGFKNPDAVRRLAVRAHELQKQVIVAKSGRSSAGAEASRSHTGKIAGDGRLWGAFAHALGFATADSIDQMIDIAEASLALRHAATKAEA